MFIAILIKQSLFFWCSQKLSKDLTYGDMSVHLVGMELSANFD